MLSQFQLVESHFEEVCLKVNSKGSFSNEAKFSQQIGCAHKTDDQRVWRVLFTLIIESENEQHPFAYEGKVSSVGFIEIQEDFPEEKIPYFVRVTGASLMFGMIREMVANITSRSEKGKLLLPSMDFRDLAKPESKLVKKGISKPIKSKKKAVSKKAIPATVPQKRTKK